MAGGCDLAEVGQLGGLGGRADVDVHADRVGTDPHGLLDPAHEDLRVRVRGMPGARAEVDDESAVPQQRGVDQTRPALVDDDGVGAARHQRADQMVETESRADGSVRDRVIQWDEQETTIGGAGKPGQPEILTRESECHGLNMPAYRKPIQTMWTGLVGPTLGVVGWGSHLVHPADPPRVPRILRILDFSYPGCVVSRLCD